MQTITTPEALHSEDFSLIVDGPLYQLLLRSQLIQPFLRHLSWRVMFIISLAWVPLFAFTIIGGRFAGV
jgi:hypothetical protein